MDEADEFPEYTMVQAGRAPERTCGRHHVVETTVALCSQGNWNHYCRSACPKCLLVGDDVDSLFACWHGGAWRTGGDPWLVWPSTFRAAFAPDFDPPGLVWDEVKRLTPRGGGWAAERQYVGRRWVYLAAYPGLSAPYAVDLLDRAEPLVGDWAFETAPDVLEATLATARCR